MIGIYFDTENIVPVTSLEIFKYAQPILEYKEVQDIYKL